MNGEARVETKVLPVDARSIGKVTAIPREDDYLDDIAIDFEKSTPDTQNLQIAAEQLKHGDYPVAFPTETVYGLGADATRSPAVQGIYKAKQRPADNPLIVHFASLQQLRDLLRPSKQAGLPETNGRITDGIDEDPVPAIYEPLISRFWPGPLTIILPNPPHSSLAPEVTAGLKTFGARMPRNILALALIKLAGVPLAAPSANASTKPSPTAAEHVAFDLDGRIETIIDGGPCDVGVESTVVDGLSDPPLILRPGGIGLEQLRACPGWERTQVGYKNAAEKDHQPKAPGMKYRHYSPKATVVLYEAGRDPPAASKLREYVGGSAKIGVITTGRWAVDPRTTSLIVRQHITRHMSNDHQRNGDQGSGFAGMLATLNAMPAASATLQHHYDRHSPAALEIIEVALSDDTTRIARHVFSTLRELDREGVEVILVEGIDDSQGDTAAAIMNRLRKAAELRV